MKTVNGLTKNAPKIFTKQVTIWAVNSNGFAQISTWVEFEHRGLGTNLQHCNDFVSKAIKDLGFKVPEDWVVRAELVFGDVGSCKDFY